MARFLFVLLLSLPCLAGVARADEDPRDAAVVAAQVKQTLEFERTGTDLPWSNPETGSSGVIRVERTYYLDPETPCRDYIRTTRRPDGEKLTMRGSGCRMGDGRWFLDEALGAEVSPPSKSAPAPAPAAAPADPAEPISAAAATARVPKTEPPESAAPKGKADAPSWDKPDDAAPHKAVAPAPPRAKPKVLPPHYTLPSRSTL